MLRSLFSVLRSAASGDAALRQVCAISQYHRIQASPGYRAAAEYVSEQLRTAGISVRTLSYSATESDRYWSLRGWEEWNCEEATLHLLSNSEAPEILCDYRAVPTSLIQRSGGFEGDAEVVLLEDGTQPEHYANLSVRGKLVLSDGDLDQVYCQAVAQRGALGVLYDRMEPKAPGRSKLDMPDFRRYTSFWWAPGQRKCFGFVLTPRQGERLRRLLRRQDHDPAAPALRVRARVVSEHYDGAMEVVEARIPGTGDQEVIIIAHLCHPIPAAHDNASGSAAALEAACVLRRLIDRGSLPTPRRSIRFLWVPEISGTYAYLADHESELENWIAGLNLDMVGADQEKTGSIFMLERPPEAMASFAPDLLERLREELFDDVTDLGTRSRHPLFRHGVTGFTGGSDHVILSDPTVGVPTPMLIQWPDRYWHTSADTVDKLDPTMLERATVLAAAYGYWLATAGKEEAYWLAWEMACRFEARLSRRAREAIGEGMARATPVGMAPVWARFLGRAEFLFDRHLAALVSLGTLSSDVEQALDEFRGYAAAALANYKARVRSAFERTSDISDLDELAVLVEQPEPWQNEADRLVPRRLFRGPVSVRAHLPKLGAKDRLAWYQLSVQAGGGWNTALRLAEYWCDGQRTLRQIADLVELESGHRLGVALLECFRLLAKMELLELNEVHHAAA